MATGKASAAVSLLASALRQFHAGRTDEARQACKRALEIAPRHPDALHLLGVIALQSGDAEGAVERLRQAVSLAPNHAEYLVNLAHGYVALQRIPEALAGFQAAARLSPRNPELQLAIGNCLGLLGRPAEAEAEFRRLVELHPQLALGWFNLAKTLELQQRDEEACAAYLQATRLTPQLAQAHTNLGHVLSRLDRFEEAERAHRASIACEPRDAQSYVNLAVVLAALRKLPETELACREALRRDATLPAARALLGRSLARQGKWTEALECYKEAAGADPRNAEVLSNLGGLLAAYGRIPEALEVLESALSLGENAPGIAFAHIGKAMILWSAGRMEEGAAAYLGREHRRRFAEQHPERPLAQALPLDLRGKSLCIVGEQGVGDQIFFLRYAPGLRARGGEITFHGNGKIASMLSRSPAFGRAVPREDPLAPADFTLLVGDLPCLAGGAPESSSQGDAAAEPAMPGRASSAGLPPPLPLEPLGERVAAVRQRLALVGPPPYVALTWRAGTGLEQQRGDVWSPFKEVPLPDLAGAIAGVRATLISVQRNPRPGETGTLATLLDRPVHDLSGANDDLEEMLALLAVLDDYVGVSNTNMHLRASLGRTARVIVPWPADWRWLVAGDESPWFPGFSIYRQGHDGDWGGALARLAADLAAEFVRN